jgi:succinoglycan biosynthesis protein ExoU
MKKTTVAVIIACYNAEKWIARAISSALAEPEVSEVIVIDDASGDRTVAVAQSADDGTGRLKILTQSCNGGPSAARNRAIHESTSEWISVLDADDFFLSGRIKGLLCFTDNADLIADDLWQVSENDIQGARHPLLGESIKLPCTVSFEEFVLGNVSKGGKQRGEMGFIKPLMRRSFLKKHNITYQEPMRLGEDYEIYTRALGHGARLLLVPPQGYISVVRSNSLSAQHSEIDLLRLRDCNRQIEMDIPALSRTEKSALRKHFISIDCRLQWRLLILAVKQRNIAAAISCFLRPFPVAWYVTRQLFDQLCERGTKKICRQK